VINITTDAIFALHTYYTEDDKLAPFKEVDQSREDDFLRGRNIFRVGRRCLLRLVVHIVPETFEDGGDVLQGLVFAAEHLLCMVTNLPKTVSKDMAIMQNI